METIKRIRIENLQRLAADPKWGSKAALSRALGYDTPSFLSQITSKSESARPFSETVARTIEQRLGLQEGWLDVDRSRTSALTPADVSACMQRIGRIATAEKIDLPAAKFSTLVELVIERGDLDDETFIRKLLLLAKQ